MANEICVSCTQCFDAEQAISKRGKIFCSKECLNTYALDYELNRIAEALERIANMMANVER